MIMCGGNLLRFSARGMPIALNVTASVFVDNSLNVLLTFCRRQGTRSRTDDVESLLLKYGGAFYCFLSLRRIRLPIGPATVLGAGVFGFFRFVSHQRKRPRRFTSSSVHFAAS